MEQIPTPGGWESFSAVVKNIDGTATFVKFIKLYQPNEQRNLQRARRDWL
jgi:hypothetical protein